MPGYSFTGKLLQGYYLKQWWDDMLSKSVYFQTLSGSLSWKINQHFKNKFYYQSLF